VGSARDLTSRRTSELRTDIAFAAGVMALAGNVWSLFHRRALRAAIVTVSLHLATARWMDALSGICDILTHGCFSFLHIPIPHELHSADVW